MSDDNATYELEEAIGSGSQGQTYRARGPDGAVVAVKKLDLASMPNWKSLELFEREIATLRSIHHPRIPAFIDAVRDDRECLLVQEFIEGQPLSEVRSLSEPQLRELAADILEILEYLHGLVPPVVHRDIKPSNIIRRPDGSHVLVDFGGVQNIVASDTGGSTVIGTTGYMPSEQLVGRAVPQSDLYALGATLAHLATGVHPSELPTVRLRIHWRDHADLPGADELADLIDAMLEPAPEDRPQTASGARAKLLNLLSTALVPETLAEDVWLAVRRPEVLCPPQIATRFTKDDELTIRLDPNPFRGIGQYFAVIFLVGLTVGALAESVVIIVAPFAIAGLAAIQMFTTRKKERLVIQPDGSFDYLSRGHELAEHRVGQLTTDVALRAEEVWLETESGEELHFGAELKNDERGWVAYEIEKWLVGSLKPSVPAELAPQIEPAPPIQPAPDPVDETPADSALTKPFPVSLPVQPHAKTPLAVLAPRPTSLKRPRAGLRDRVREQPTGLQVAVGPPRAMFADVVLAVVASIVLGAIALLFFGPLTALWVFVLMAMGAILLARASKGPRSMVLLIDPDGTTRLRHQTKHGRITTFGTLSRPGNSGLVFKHDEGFLTLAEELSADEVNWLCAEIYLFLHQHKVASPLAQLETTP